jgi:hypothetical protein
MSEHLKEVPPAARLLGREIISVNAPPGEVQLRFLAHGHFANRHGTIQGGMLAAMLDSATGNVWLVSGANPKLARSYSNAKLAWCAQRARNGLPGDASNC